MPAYAETLEVGAYPANPPWENKKEDGSFEGFEVDLVNEIGKRIGADMHIQDLGFQALFAATSSGRIDMAISSITITNERLQSQSFTQGYYDSDMALATAVDSGVNSLADMKGKPVGVLSTSTGETWAKENMEKYGFTEVKGYNAQQDLLLDTQAGRVGGAVSDIAGLQFAFMQMPKMQVVERIKTSDKLRHHDEEGLAQPAARQRRDHRHEAGRHARRDPQEVARRRRRSEHLHCHGAGPPDGAVGRRSGFAKGSSGRRRCSLFNDGGIVQQAGGAGAARS